MASTGISSSGPSNDFMRLAAWMVEKDSVDLALFGRQFESKRYVPEFVEIHGGHKESWSPQCVFQVELFKESPKQTFDLRIP